MKVIVAVVGPVLILMVIGLMVGLEGALAIATSHCQLAVAEGTLAFEPLLVALTDSESRKRQCSAAEALAVLGDQRAIQPLVQALDHEEKDTRIAAKKALRMLNWQPTDQELSTLQKNAAQRTRKADEAVREASRYRASLTSCPRCGKSRRISPMGEGKLAGDQLQRLWIQLHWNV